MDDMSDITPEFQKYIMHSSLFNGHSDRYFCFLKSEKIARVCAVLVNTVSLTEAPELRECAASAARLPKAILYFSAGKIDLADVLADICSLLFEIRLCVVRGGMTRSNADVLSQEYEIIAEKLGNAAHLSAPLSSHDFVVSNLLAGGVQATPAPSVSLLEREEILKKDSVLYKGHSIKDIPDKSYMSAQNGANDQTARTAKILEYIKNTNPVSIKDITHFVRGCSEKTIQRDLNALIGQGLIQRMGERRWSQYAPAR